ncbi:GNAT family N-acetyltransferase [Micromonospora inyonensis]|uniref:Ribosomal protein S18 acetylase RimI n=1 Tax=Micromonospora inyonensis TaxID=47866 RepID=A0A1C6RAU9_9ACTN|nr:GNAT family N-acetyltransferase [Micromonospora inyonensis]SCL14262.1 Ribosomal protein S18 acetylase RimI [Micromonospora inyonensis]
MVREWDPRTASSAEMASLLATLNAVLAADLPDDPPWRETALREYLSEVMPGERRISWVARTEPAADGTPGAIVGHVHVLLLGDIGVLEVLVHPSVRRTGLGRDLVRLAARRTYQEGFRSVGVEVVGGTPAMAFFEALGFGQDYVETRSVLRLGTVDWAALEAMATGIGTGYRIEFCPGGPPDELIESYARAKAESRDVEDGDLRPSSYDPQRLRDSLDCLHRRGMKPYVVFAIHERTGEVAGLTEVVVPAQHPTRADQYDTIVVPDHRGHGIDRAIKARMLLDLRAAEPELTEVQTWNAQANEAMLAVNAELGYRPDRQWCEYGADVAELVHRLDALAR